jgi:hypothetical protein
MSIGATEAGKVIVEAEENRVLRPNARAYVPFTREDSCPAAAY